MKAVMIDAYGPPERFTLGELPIPQAGPGQIQVRIAAASVNPMDIRLAAGDYRGFVEAEFPLVPGNDFAGTVSAVGAGVTAYTIGDEVFGHAVPRAMKAMGGASRPSLTTGTLAEFAVFEADTPFIARRPGGLGIEEAAALPTAGLVVRALIKAAAPRAGETVLVIGASGGVGTTLLPELAHTHVIATGRPGDVLGAAEIIGYDDDYPGGVDVVINLVLPPGRLDRAERAAKKDGRLFTVTGRDEGRFEMVLATDGDMRDVAGLTPTIGRRYPLTEGARALQDLKHRHTLGKLVVSLPRP